MCGMNKDIVYIWHCHLDHKGEEGHFGYNTSRESMGVDGYSEVSRVKYLEL